MLRFQSTEGLAVARRNDRGTSLGGGGMHKLINAFSVREEDLRMGRNIDENAASSASVVDFAGGLS